MKLEIGFAEAVTFIYSGGRVCRKNSLSIRTTRLFKSELRVHITYK